MLRDVSVIDGTGAAPLEHRSVTIAGERLRAIEPDDSTTPPPGATVIALPGRTLVPGLISAHSHLGMVDGTTARAANGTRANVLRQVAHYAHR
jgi:imidazolonepropionase-like amidohydrolase